MSSIVIAGDTSGSVTLQAPAVSGSTVLNLPATSGTIQASGAGYTTNGVAYATSATGLVTGSTLSYNGTRLLIGGVSAGTIALSIPAGDITSDVSSGAFAIGNYGDTSSELRLSTRGFTTFRTGATDGTNGTERARITSAGNVGIGLTNPGNKLQVAVDGTYTANIAANSGNGARIVGTDYNNATFQPMYVDGSIVGIQISGSERARFDTSGNLGIGTTSPSTWGTKLVVYNGQLTITGSGYDGAYADSIFFGGNSEGTNYRNKISNSLSASVANQLMKFSVASGTSTWVDALILRGDGLINTGLATNSPYNATTGNAANANLGSDGILRRSTSSLKYKTDVQNTTHGLAEVLALRPVTYKGKSEADGDTVFGGLIAEEVHEAGLTEFVQYAQDGSPDALAYGNMVSLAFKAIQEQQALITTLTERITALEAK